MIRESPIWISAWQIVPSGVDSRMTSVGPRAPACRTRSPSGLRRPRGTATPVGNPRGLASLPWLTSRIRGTPTIRPKTNVRSSTLLLSRTTPQTARANNLARAERDCRLGSGGPDALELGPVEQRLHRLRHHVALQFLARGRRLDTDPSGGGQGGPQDPGVARGDQEQRLAGRSRSSRPDRWGPSSRGSYQEKWGPLSVHRRRATDLMVCIATFRSSHISSTAPRRPGNLVSQQQVVVREQHRVEVEALEAPPRASGRCAGRGR